MSLLSLFRTPGRSVSLRQKTGWIGIDIGSGAIKIAQLHRSGARLRIARSLVIRAEDNRPFDMASFENGRIGEAIRNAMKGHAGFQGREAVCAISMAHCQLRTLVSARGSEEEQRELISLEIENDHMGATGPQEFEFWDAATDEQSEIRGMTQLHVLSIPKTLSESIANTLMQAKLQCQLLDGVPFAAVRASEMAASHSTAASVDNSYAVLDWGYSAATLMVVHQGQPFMTRTLKHCGLQRILQAISQRLQLSSLESEAMLTTYGVANTLRGTGEKTELQSLITELCASVIADLVEEIHETVSFIQMQFPQQRPSHVCLIGGGAAIRNIDVLFRQQVCLPFQAWNLRGASAEPVSPVLATATALSALAWEL